jgi:GDPmannose 4,6-dehydratase
MRMAAAAGIGRRRCESSRAARVLVTYGMSDTRSSAPSDRPALSAPTIPATACPIPVRGPCSGPTSMATRTVRGGGTMRVEIVPPASFGWWWRTIARLMPRAFVTGITGQDGQHLAEFLHSQGYEVFGMVKGQNNPRAQSLADEFPFVNLVSGDLADLPSLVSAIEACQPDEVYNLGAISFVALSFSQAELTANLTGLGVLRMLEAIRMVGGSNNNPIRFYQASSSEMFGKVRETPQTELTPFHPRSPYGCAKVFGHDIVVNYRESYGLHASSGILFNHEGPRRGLEFVTRKVTNAAARIKLGLQDEVVLGNLDSKRDWGYAGDYVKAMWLMLQQPEPGDYVIATGETHSIEDLVQRAFGEVGIDNWRDHVRQDPKFLRPAEVDLLIGDPSKAKTVLGWEPEVDFPTLIKMMVTHDLQLEATKAGLPLPA